MTTEDDFQAALDANPDDHVTRLVFADWLDERGDPRAAGYRALGVLRVHPSPDDSAERDKCPYWVRVFGGSYVRHSLPTDWFKLLDVEGKYDDCAPLWSCNRSATRRGLEDAAALAFAQLPAARQAELLAGVPA